MEYKYNSLNLLLNDDQYVSIYKYLHVLLVCCSTYPCSNQTEPPGVEISASHLQTLVYLWNLVQHTFLKHRTSSHRKV